MISGEFALDGEMGTPTKLKSLITTRDLEVAMDKRQIEPIHPGEILLEEFLNPMGITQYRIAKDINVDPRRINEIVLGKRSISADTALRLSRYFGTSERFWLNLQSRYDLELQKLELGDRLEEIGRAHV